MRGSQATGGMAFAAHAMSVVESVLLKGGLGDLVPDHGPADGWTSLPEADEALDWHRFGAV